MNSGNKYTPATKKLKREKTTLSSNSDSDKDPVQVYCRLRPLKDGAEPSPFIKLISSETLALITPSEIRGTKKEMHYKFRHIFTAFSTQQEIFSHVAYPLLEDLLNAKNGLLFTYGVTGSGKTHTITGDYENPGILPRCIDTIFNTIAEYQAPKYIIKSDKMNGFEVQSENDAVQDRFQAVRHVPRTPKVRKLSDKISYKNDGTKIHNIDENNLYSVFVSYIEIYNNSVFDLLDESSGKSLQNKILREDCQKNMYVNGVVEVEVKTSQEAFEVFQAGQNRKKMAVTSLNADSSRSHSIFNIRIVQLEQVSLNCDGKPAVPTDNVIKVGQLSLVDLAGSERTNRTNNTGIRLKEASSINNSLMSLRACLEILRENQRTKSYRLVPYRDSRLTFLFKHYFEGDGSVKMIVCINPSVGDFEENVQVLKFAEMTQDVKIKKPEIKYTPLRKQLKVNKENIHSVKTKIGFSDRSLPDIPIVKFNFDDLGECEQRIENLVNILKLRKQKVKDLNKDIEERQAAVRKRVLEMNQENVLSKAEIGSLKAIVQKEKQRCRNLQIKMTDLETANQEVQSKNDNLQEIIRSLQNTITEKDLKINQNILEKEKTKQKLALASEKMNQELDSKLRRQREHLNAAMKAKDEKLRIVKEIIESEMPPVEVNSTKAEPENVKTQSLQTPLSKSSITTPQRRNMLATSTPRPRRSRSAGEVWLEHNAIKPCPLGTVFQPTMKKRKSVSKLSKATDVTNPKQSKYCLIAQEPDTEGEMETKMYKGDIVQTCGGGAQVIFNDVERLRQESPTRANH